MGETSVCGDDIPVADRVIQGHFTILRAVCSKLLKQRNGAILISNTLTVHQRHIQELPLFMVELIIIAPVERQTGQGQPVHVR